VFALVRCGYVYSRFFSRFTINHNILYISRLHGWQVDFEPHKWPFSQPLSAGLDTAAFSATLSSFLTSFRQHYNEDIRDSAPALIAALMGDLPPSRSQDDEAHESDDDHGGEGGGGCGDGDGGDAVGVVGDGGGAYGGDERGVAGPVMRKTSSE
jgi:hypothetical protein